MGSKMRAIIMALLLLPVLLAGCAKRVRFEALPLAGPATATARIKLTYDRNNNLQVQLTNVPDPSRLNPTYSRYVLWAATPDRQHVINIGQLRVDENKKAEIKTLTSLRSFILLVTAEPRGDVMVPGPDTLFQTKQIDW